MPDPIWATRRQAKLDALPEAERKDFRFDFNIDYSPEEQQEIILEVKYAKELQKRGLFKGLKKIQQYKKQAIDYIDPAPKPFTVQISLVECFERIKRFKADRWQQDFGDRLQEATVNRHLKGIYSIIHAEGQLGKSSWLAQVYPAWILGHDPLHRFALATYNVRRSQRHSKTTIGIMNLPIYRDIFPNKSGWVDEKSSVEKWSTEARKQLNDGQDSFNPVGLQSGLTGSGFDTLCIDDPYADQKEAFSETVRQNLIDFWEFTVLSRLSPYSNVFGMFHRYHVEDLAGYLLSTGDFDYWRYATVCDGDYVHEGTGRKYPDPIGREVGEYISPERRPPLYYEKSRKNSRVWNSMFQGKPTSDEGEFFQVGKIRILTDAEAFQRRQECSILVRAWDLAATKDDGDFTTAPLIGMSADEKTTIFDAVHKQTDPASTDALMLNTAQMDGQDVIITIPVDPGAAGKTAVFHYEQLLKGFTVIPRPISGNKEVRAHSFASAVNSGDVSFAPGVWNEEMKRELRNFPLSEHDDYVDSGADGYNECFERISTGLVVKKFRSQTNLKTYQWFQSQFPHADGFKIPKEFTVYVGVKITPEENQANSAIIVARGSELSKIPDILFGVAEYKAWTSDYAALFTWLDETLNEVCERPMASTIWLHQDSEAYKPTIQQKLKQAVRIFHEDNLAGITEMNWYISEGKFYGLVEPEQVTVAKDPFGLISLRQETMTWNFNDKGEPSKVGSVLDCLRMVTYRFRTVAKPLSMQEKIRLMIPQEAHEAMAQAPTGTEKLSALINLEFQEEFATMTLNPRRDEDLYE